MSDDLTCSGCGEYAGTPIADRIEELEVENKRLRLEAAHANDTADAAIERVEELEAERDALRAKLEAAVEALQWFIDNDDTSEGDVPIPHLNYRTWSEMNAYWIDGLNNGRATLAELKGQDDE